jgi:hypothetical protein
LFTLKSSKSLRYRSGVLMLFVGGDPMAPRRPLADDLQFGFRGGGG